MARTIAKTLFKGAKAFKTAVLHEVLSKYEVLDYFFISCFVCSFFVFLNINATLT